MKILEKFNETKESVKNYFSKTKKTIRWEVRYNNLLKKYETVCQENNELESKLDMDEMYRQNLDLKRQIKRKNYIIENLQNDNKKLMGVENNEL